MNSAANISAAELFNEDAKKFSSKPWKNKIYKQFAEALYGLVYYILRC